MKRSKAPPRRPAPPEPAKARRAEILDTALRLIAEHGIAGASLRMLAKELAISQPSLYHYFPSKDALVEEIIEYCAENMLNASRSLAPPRTREEIPRFARDAVFGLWSGERHPRFVAFMFVVALESRKNRATIQNVFEERLYPGFALLGDAYGRDDEERELLRYVLRMVIYSLGLMFLEERALFAKPDVNAEIKRYSEWVVKAGEALIAAHEASRSPKKRR